MSTVNIVLIVAVLGVGAIAFYAASRKSSSGGSSWLSDAQDLGVKYGKWL